MIKKVISLILLLIWIALVWIFAFPKETKSIADKFWFWEIFNQITNFKSWLDETVRNSDEVINNVTDQITNTGEDLKQKALEIKESTTQKATNILNTK
jgi:predicted PurR-regulated permease PerM